MIAALSFIYCRQIAMSNRSWDVLLLATLIGPLAALADAGHEHGNPAPIGVPAPPEAKARTVTVVMDDTMRFTPAIIDVRQGETIRFVVQNRGQLRHEMVLGRMADLKAHAELMQRFPNMVHDEPNMVTVEPGASAELRWTFTRSGTVDFACLVPGHYESGMRGELKVVR